MTKEVNTKAYHPIGSDAMIVAALQLRAETLSRLVRQALAGLAGVTGHTRHGAAARHA